MIKQFFRIKKIRLSGWMLVLAFALTGCGSDKPRMVACTGKVIHNGKPVTAGSINFFPDAANSFQKDNPSSILQLDGSFTAKTFPWGEGIPPGMYRVTLAPQLAARLNASAYGSPEKTPWKIEVPENGLPDQILEVKTAEAQPDPDQ